MRTLGITGGSGFLGWHLRCFLLANGEPEPLLAGRSALGDMACLQAFVRECDIIVHLAGANRGTEQEVERTNVSLARALDRACDAVEAQCHLIFASTTQRLSGGTYGRSKLRAGEILRTGAERRGAKYTEIVIPHAFGEEGRPFYNSVTATFCELLAGGQALEVNPSGTVELLYAQDIAKQIWKVAHDGCVGEHELSGRRIAVPELAAKLTGFADQYRTGAIPELADEFELRLFNTLRSHLFPALYPIHAVVHADSRGTLFEALRTRSGGQVFVSHTLPGHTRGNHYHLRKIERFMVLGGEAVISVRKLLTRERRDFTVTGDDPCLIDMPTLHTHCLTPLGQRPVTTLFWISEPYDPADPDTFAHEV